MIKKKSVLNEMMSVRLLASLGLAALLLVSASASAQVAPNLLSASSYSILAGSQVTNTGPSSISGDVGISPGAAGPGLNHPGLTAAMVGGTIHDVDLQAANAMFDQAAAYTQLDLLNGCTFTYPGAFGELAGQSLVPGVYCATQFRLSSGTLTLTGLASDTWVFKSASDLVITGGASARVVSPSCDVWWRVVSTASFDANSSLIGNILADTSITLAAGASLSGRAFARTAAVTLSSNTISACAACPTITLAPNPLPNATVGVAYNQQITPTPAGTYNWTVTSGTLSGTLTLSPTGLLSGTPATAGSVTIRATDLNGCFSEILLTIVPAGCPTITLAPNPLPNATVGVAYNQQITPTPAGTYNWTVTNGTLSGTLTLSATGLLSGTPTTAGSVTIRATDGTTGCFAEILLRIVAGCPTITLAPNPLPNGMVGLNYNQLITPSPAGVYTFTVSNGTLSGTMTLTPGGLLSGVPTTAGTITIRATDVAGCFAEIPFTVVAATTAGIPTLPGWGLIIFSALLGLVSVYFVRKASGA